MLKIGFIFYLLFMCPFLTEASKKNVILNPEDLKTIDDGKIITRISPSHNKDSWEVFSAGYVKKKKEDLWRILTEPEIFIKVYTEVLECSIIGRKEDTVHFRSVLDYPWPLQNRWIITKVIQNKKNFRISSKRVDGSVADSESSWELKDYKEGTLVKYRTFFCPGLKSVPDWVVKWASSKIVPRMVTRLRETTPFYRVLPASASADDRN